jgi:hypothetical protein
VLFRDIFEPDVDGSVFVSDQKMMVFQGRFQTFVDGFFYGN